MKAIARWNVGSILKSNGMSIDLIKNDNGDLFWIDARSPDPFPFENFQWFRMEIKAIISDTVVHKIYYNMYPYPPDWQENMAEILEPKNNGMREFCYWCGNKTKQIQGFTEIYSVCNKCGK